MIDSKTISAVLGGDPQAFEKVYLQTHDKAYSIAYRVVKDEYEAEDIVQDAYLTMIEKLCDLKEAERLEGWFYRIVQNGAKDNLRKRHAEVFTNFDNDEEDFQFSDTIVSDYAPFDPEANADYEELKRIMDGFVMGLPEMQRKCILLRFRGDKKISEIAQMLGIPEATVKSNLNYGKRKIEGEVRALEKQGVKLYSLTPVTAIAFLRWMWGKSAASAVSVGIKAASATAAAASGGTAAAASGGAAAAGGGAAVGAASGAGGVAAAAKTGLALGAKKLIAGVCAALVIGGGTAGVLLSQPEKQLEKIVTIEKEGRYEDVFPRSYCLPQISDSEHDWTELNQQLQAAYDRWEFSFNHHIEHLEEFKAELGEDYVQEFADGKQPERTNCSFTLSVAPPFLGVIMGTGVTIEPWFVGEAEEAYYQDWSYEQAVEEMKYSYSGHSYSLNTGKPVTHEDVMQYLNLTEEEYIQLLHDSLDKRYNEWAERKLSQISPDDPKYATMVENMERSRAAGHRLIGSDALSWKYPLIRVSSCFQILLFDDESFKSYYQARMTGYWNSDLDEYEHPLVEFTFGEVGRTEVGYYEYGKTEIRTGSNLKIR